jgi:hypothetical protein
MPSQHSTNQVHVQQPSNFAAQGNAYSSYKGHTTFKFLVAVAPDGTIVYLSDAFQCSISDKEQSCLVVAHELPCSH